jgi:hypothetical protein
MDGGDGTVRLGALHLKPDRSVFDSGVDVSVSSPVTRQKAAAAKQFIENHYKNYLQGLQDRKDRYGVWIQSFDFLFLFLCSDLPRIFKEIQNLMHVVVYKCRVRFNYCFNYLLNIIF